MFIFDLDGTLIDSGADLALAVNLTRKDFGLEPLPADLVISFVGNGAKSLISRSFAGTDVDPEKALPVYAGHYAGHLLDNTYLYDGIAESLKQLADSGISMAVVTNKPETATRQILEGLGVLGYFAAVTGGGSCYALKPEPDALLHCLEISGDKAGESWMIGDHYTDLEAGRRAGFRRAFCRWGIGETRGEECDIELAHPSEIAELLKRGK